VSIADTEYPLSDLPSDLIVPCEPQFGWKGHIERQEYVHDTQGEKLSA